MRISASRQKLYVFLLLVPLLLAALPALQAHRVHRVGEDRATLARFLEAGGGASDSTLPAPAGFEQYPRRFVAGPIEDRLRKLDGQQGSLALRGVLSAAGLLGAIGAFVLGVVILVKIRRDSTRARRSFTFFIDHVETSWRQVSRLQLCHIGLTLATLVAAVLYEGVAGYSDWHSQGPMGVGMTLPLWWAIGCGVVLIYRGRRAMAPPAPLTLDILGRPQPRTEAPALWAWVDDIARRVNAPAPDHIVVGLEDNFHVTRVDVRLHPSGRTLQGRTLYLPLPYVCALSRDETAAIIGHELAHFAHGDTEHGHHLAMVHGKMRRKLGDLLRHHAEYPSWLGEPPIWTSIKVVESFEDAYLHWSRIQEFAADQAGARAAGPAASARALVRVTALAGAIETFRAQHRAPHDNHVQALLDHLAAHDLVLDVRALEATIAHPVDSHPPTRARIDALAVAIDETLLRDATRRPTAEDTRWFTRLLSQPSMAA
jgi:Zn-dependent protease with chaperone function